STCPWTRWPPSRAASVTGRSRLTGAPVRTEPRVVRSSVSPLRSKASVSTVCSTTVRQVPFTATDAPTGLSVATSGHATTSRPPSSARTAPSSSTIPVNIGLHPDVGADRIDPDEGHIHRRVDRCEALPHHGARGTGASHDAGGDVLHDPVHRAVAQEAPCERRATLQQHALDVTLAEGLEEGARRDAAGGIGCTDGDLD